MILMLFLASITSGAANDVNQVSAKTEGFMITQQLDNEYQLNVKQAPWVDLLAMIANKAGVKINYAVLPAELVTARCSGSSVKQVLECVLVGKADLVFRYADEPAPSKSVPKLAEVWIVSPKSGSHAEPNTLLPADTTEITKKAAEPDQTPVLLKMAGSNVAAERIEAMGRLLAEGKRGDAAVTQVLLAGLADPDPLVRVRALSTYAHREGRAAATAINDALHDSNVSVRLTAVDNAGENEALLQQALKDTNETVRQLAEQRLRQLSKGVEQPPLFEKIN